MSNLTNPVPEKEITPFATIDSAEWETIYHALNAYAAGSHSEEELTHLFLFCQKIAISHLKYLDYLAPANNSFEDLRLELEDEANTCLARLFVPANKNSTVSVLAESWLHIHNNGATNTNDAYLHLVNIVRNIVWQQRIEMLRQSHPQEWKMRRNLRRHVNHSEGYTVVRSRKELFICPSHIREGRINPVPEAMLREHCMRTFDGRDSLEDYLSKALSLVKAKNLFYNCLKFEELSAIITDFQAHILKTHLQNAEATVPEETPNGMYMFRQAMRLIGEKLKDKYVQKGKIPQQTATMYFRALGLFLRDLLSLEPILPYYEYLKHVMPDLTRQQFTNHHRARFSYLVSETRRILTELVDET